MNPEKNRNNSKKWAKANPLKAKEATIKWRVANQEQVKKTTTAWETRHPENIKANRRKTNAKRRSTPRGRLSESISRNIYAAIRENKAGRHWENLVDYTLGKLVSHIEKLFTPEMNWGNYGSYWEIDHKIPTAVFNFEKPEDIDFKKCWALDNLQPLAVSENRKKRHKLNKPFQPALLMG